MAGKEGIGYLLRDRHLGGIGGAAFSKQICTGAGSYGGTATLSLGPPIVKGFCPADQVMDTAVS